MPCEKKTKKKEELVRKLVTPSCRESDTNYSMSLLSYTQWTPERILQTIRDSKKDILMIMGSKDERLGPNWLQQLQATGKPLHILQGANHFMDGEYEFELLDRILTELKPQ